MTIAARTPGWHEAVRRFPEHVRDRIDAIWDNHGCLPAEAVASVCTAAQADIGWLMMQLLPVAQQYAVVPVSNYAVGAVAAGMPVGGWASLYLGANFEFANAALSFTVHAEQAATNNAWLSGEQGMQALAISAAPCGYCRQFLYELVTANQLNILLPGGTPGSYTLTPLTTFLPQPFGPNDLGVNGGLMDPQYCTHSLTLTSGNPSDPVIAAAFQAAEGCYAPYSTPPNVNAFGYAGVAVQFSDGSIMAGRNAENAAFNPSLSPLESALAYANMSQPQAGALPTVTRCVLVEVPTVSTQRGATSTVLAAYAPAVTLEYYTAQGT